MTVELHHSLDGPADAPVLVLGSSVGATSAMWDENVEELARHFRVVRFDARGHGRSPVPDGPYTMDELGADVLALLDRLDLERVSYCGLSMGGMIGMWLASEAPERVERLVLCCTVPYFPPPELWNERIEIARTQGMEPMVDAAIERWVPPELPEAAEHLRAIIRSVPPEGYAACCEAIRDMDLRERLAGIEAPTLVVAASEDPSTPPEKVRPIADAIDGARYLEFDRARHIVNVARPRDFERALLDHLST